MVGVSVDYNDNNNQESNIEFQNLVDNKIPSINDVLSRYVSLNNDSNDINSNVVEVVVDSVEQKNNSSGCSYCECCGRLIDNEGNLLGIDDKNKELLIDTFIGKNFEKIRNKKFSFSAFLFGYFYLAYRKMYLYAFLVFFFESLFIPLFSFSLFFNVRNVLRITLLLFFRIFLAIKFSNIYLKFVQNKIDFYEKKYNHYLDNILLVCNKKGGTNIFSFVIYLLYLVFLFLIITNSIV